MMWYEERDQGRAAMRAAGWVAVNRIGQPKDDGSAANFPGTLIEVLDEPGQFASRDPDPAGLVKDTDPQNPDRLRWADALEDAPGIVARQGTDPTGGFKYFGNVEPGYDVRALMVNCKQTVPGFQFEQIGHTSMYISNKPYTNCPIPTPTP
jgi:hypothetical protein